MGENSFLHHNSSGSGGSASLFFSQHKALFEFDTFVGGSPISISSSSSSPSFLDRYIECEQLQSLDRARLGALHVDTSSSTASTSTSFVSAVAPVAFALSSVSLLRHHDKPADYHQSRSSPQRRHDHRGHTYSNQSTTTATTTATASPLPFPSFSPPRPSQPQPPPPLSSPQRTRLPSPSRFSDSPRQQVQHQPHHHHHHGIPPLDDLLVDVAHRAMHMTTTKRMDDAVRVELLIGSKCGGRMSAAASSHLPAAIRRRLDAATKIHTRREQLYEVLKHDYTSLTSHLV